MIFVVKFFFDMKLYFSDEDGDLITFSSQEELNEAMVNGTEELTVYIQGKYLLQITKSLSHVHLNIISIAIWIYLCKYTK